METDLKATRGAIITQASESSIRSLTEGILRATARTFLGLPSMVWSRLLVLFVGLTAIKLALLVGLGKRLFEVHWRLTPYLPVWGDSILFGLFVLIGFLTLLRLQQHCAIVGLRAVRAANAIVLSLGFIFIFLT